MSTVVEISASMVKELREKSGAAMMDCKNALKDAEGNFEKAFELLRQKGAASASKKAGRTTSEGLVVGYTTPDSKVGTLVELNCETDFVARNEQFVALGKTLAETAAQKDVSCTDKLNAELVEGKKVQDLLTEAVGKIGENISLKRVKTIKLSSAYGTVGLYLHALGGKMGALVELATDKQVADQDALNAVGRELAMHVVSTKPSFLSREEIPADVIENERRIESGKADLAEKKPEMREKIVSGRVDKILGERCFLEQPFIKDPQTTVAKYLVAKGKELGVEIKPLSFAVYILGETEAEKEATEACAQ
jgi:elongation factor Ts